MEYINSNHDNDSSSSASSGSNKFKSHQADFVIIDSEPKHNCKVFNLKRNQFVSITNHQEESCSSYVEGRMQQQRQRQRQQHHVEFVMTDDKRKKNQNESRVGTKFNCKPIMSIKDDNLKNCQLKNVKKVPFVIQ